MRNFTYVFSLVIIVSLFSCVPSKRLYYFNDKLPGKDSVIDSIQASLQKVHKNDRLNITVSSTDPALTAYLNPFGASSGTLSSSTGYLVNDSGNIEFPLLGQLQVNNLSTVQIAKLIKDKLSYYYKDLFVNVNLRGQVYFLSGRSGTPIPMMNERLTIFEAISQSGAPDPYDKKNEVWLIRESSGERLYTKLDLNSKDIFQSPYYYLQNNDLLYMKPGKFSSFLSPTSPARNVLTITASLVALFITIKNL